MSDDRKHDSVLEARGRVRDPNGLHLKVASEISRACAKFSSTRVTITAGNGRTADARSPLALLTLGASAEQLLVIAAQGPDAQAALAALEPYVLLEKASAPVIP